MKTKKILMAAVALVLVCVISVMGTLAYLTATTSEAVVNTFTTAGLVKEAASFVLDESKANPDTANPGKVILDTSDRVKANSYTLVPGVNVDKDPTVTIKKDELLTNAYLFVEVKSAITSGLGWEMDTGWTELTGKTGANGGQIYAWNTVLTTDAAKTADIKVNVLKDKTMTVPGTYTSSSSETLSFWGYLCQSGGFADAAAAWDACFAPAP